MKPLVIISCVFVFFCCTRNTEKIKKPDFLVGNWIRINEKKESKTYETCKKDLTGIGYTLQDKDTTFKEILKIISLNDTLFLSVRGNNKNITLFKITSQTDTSFIAENAKNEFPKKILYYKENNFLKAEVSIPDFKVDFIFESIK